MHWISAGGISKLSECSTLAGRAPPPAGASLLSLESGGARCQEGRDALLIRPTSASSGSDWATERTSSAESP